MQISNEQQTVGVPPIVSFPDRLTAHRIRYFYGPTVICPLFDPTLFTSEFHREHHLLLREGFS